MQSRYSNEYLMHALAFTPEDLAANRGGVMTLAQQERFRERMSKSRSQAAVVVLLVLLITGGFFAYMIFGNAEEGSGLRQALDQNPTIIVLGLGGSLLLYLVVIAYAFWRMRRMQSGNLRVSSIEGKVKLRSSEMAYYSVGGAISTAAGAQTRVCEIQIGRTRMYTDEQSFDALEDGGTYRLYFVGNKRAPVIISAELA
jgi:hypothetical protein